jgi:hypothetical protein
MVMPVLSTKTAVRPYDPCELVECDLCCRSTKSRILPKAWPYVRLQVAGDDRGFLCNDPMIEFESRITSLSFLHSNQA